MQLVETDLKVCQFAQHKLVRVGKDETLMG